MPRKLTPSIRELARKSGLDPATIWRILRRGREPKLETAEKLAKAMGITLDQLGDRLRQTAAAPTLREAAEIARRGT